MSPIIFFILGLLLLYVGGELLVKGAISRMNYRLMI